MALTPTALPGPRAGLGMWSQEGEQGFSASVGHVGVRLNIHLANVPWFLLGAGHAFVGMPPVLGQAAL